MPANDASQAPKPLGSTGDGQLRFGVCVASHVGDIGYIERAEALGFSHAWVADSQMLWSDCYATLALAATRTRRINLGTGVAVTGTRPASVNAAGIATINALAPGRTFFGVGTGNTAMRVMGRKPHNIREFETYLAALKVLLRGEEAPGDDGQPIRHVMPDKGFVNFSDPIPLYVSGFGPRSLALAGKYGDGAIFAAGAANGVRAAWHLIDAGADGRALSPDNFPTSTLTTIVVLEDGERADSDRVKHQCGAMAMAAVHFAYDQYRNFGHQPPNAYSGIWDDYTAMLAAFPVERRHQRIHAGHNCWVIPEEARFLTPEVLATGAMVGTRDQLIERLSAMHEAGLGQVVILPNFDTRFDVLESVAENLIGHIA